MGAVGTSADNALAESFNATLKREVLRDRKVFVDPITCRQEVFRWCMWGCPQIVDTLLSCLGVKQRFSYYHFDQRAGLRNRRD